MLIIHSQGSILDILKPGPLLSSASLNDCEPDGICELSVFELVNLEQDSTHEFVNADGAKFTVFIKYEYLMGQHTRIAEVTAHDDNGDKKTMSIYLGYNSFCYYAFFIPTTSQLGLIANGCFQLWTLATGKTRACELVMYLKYQKFPEVYMAIKSCYRVILAAKACKHGMKFNLRLSAPEFYTNVDNGAEDLGPQHEDLLTIPVSPEDTLGTSDEQRLADGYVGLIDFYSWGGEDVKRSIARYLKSHIRLTSDNPVSSLITYCRIWTQDLSSALEVMIADMLPNDCIT